MLEYLLYKLPHTHKKPITTLCVYKYEVTTESFYMYVYTYFSSVLELDLQTKMEI